MQTRTINATSRPLVGKGPARRMRVQGKIPAVAYGKHLQAMSLSVEPKELQQALSSEFGRNTVVELDVEGHGKLTALVKDYQYHPVSRSLLHADFIQIDLSQPVDVEVPLELTGRPKGVVLGGVVHQPRRVLPLRCLPEQIPAKVVKDITPLELDQSYAVSDLELPEGVTVRLPPKQTIVLIAAERRKGAESAAEEGAAGAAAPAADAKAGEKKAEKKPEKKADKK